uniref:Protein kinase domain-containing protein n=1 Tax=Amphilophus citrinellus TaxID=61819 RepID=A0A3Q0R396_AMPCI
MCDGPRLEEVIDAINQLKNNKSSGTDGLVSEFYNSFTEDLAPFLFEVYLESKEDWFSLQEDSGNQLEKFLGQGVFGFVTKCINTQTNKAVAVKVNKNDPKILQQAKLEMFMLEQLQCLDPESCNIVRWNSIFFYFLDRERICLNFELLDQSLFDYTKDRNFQPLPISELSSMGIVHTDLKTDNLMIVDRRQSPIKVKIIDFGLACLVSSLTPDVTVQPIFYRAPEVMLNAPFNEAIDMWSLGLIAAELAIGRPLYPGKMEIDVFRFITLTQGQPPDHVLDHGNQQYTDNHPMTITISLIGCRHYIENHDTLISGYSLTPPSGRGRRSAAKRCEVSLVSLLLSCSQQSPSTAQLERAMGWHAPGARARSSPLAVLIYFYFFYVLHFTGINFYLILFDKSLESVALIGIIFQC